MSASDSRGLRLAGPERVEQLLDELARQIGPGLGEDTALVGILRRGAPLARHVAERLAQSGMGAPEVGELKLKRYADDLTLLHQQPRLDRESLGIDVADRHLILVDDVMYTGQSLFRACCFLREQGAARLQLAVLCARGKPDMPLRADFVGLQLDVGPDWIIDCAVPPYEDTLGICINPRSGSR